MDKTKLQELPPSVGRLRKLQFLSLSSNDLSTLPITLQFCCNLETLDLSGNKFPAIPGVVLRLEKLTSLKRLGNAGLLQRWDGLQQFPHLKVNKPKDTPTKDEPDSLQSQAARSVMASQINYWSVDNLPSLQCKLLDTYGSKYRYCHNCYTPTATNDGKHIAAYSNITSVCIINRVVFCRSSDSSDVNIICWIVGCTV